MTSKQVQVMQSLYCLFVFMIEVKWWVDLNIYDRLQNLQYNIALSLMAFTALKISKRCNKMKHLIP